MLYSKLAQSKLNMHTKELAYLAFSIKVQRTPKKQEGIKRFIFSAHIWKLSYHFTLQRKINKSYKGIPIQLAGGGEEAGSSQKKKPALEDSCYNRCLKCSWFPQKVTQSSMNISDYQGGGKI